MNIFGDPKWEAVSRPGGIFCAPRCGGNCKRKDYDRAVRDAAKLAECLGEGWEPEVWENLGWHWRVNKGVVSIHCHGPLEYTCYFNGAHQVITTAETPEDALGFAKQDARTLISTLEAQLAEAI